MTHTYVRVRVNVVRRVFQATSFEMSFLRTLLGADIMLQLMCRRLKYGLDLLSSTLSLNDLS